MNNKEIRTILDNIPREELTGKVYEWMQIHPDFKEYMLEGYVELSEGTESVDFDQIMYNAMRMNLPEVKIGGLGRRLDYGDEILRWDKVYRDVILPYEKSLTEMSTNQLVDFASAILATIVPSLSREDFWGDEWYGTDYSADIQNILRASDAAIMEAVSREDFTRTMGDALLSALETANENHDLSDYDVHFGFGIEELVNERIASESVTQSTFDKLAEIGNTGYWTIRKIKYLESIGDYPMAEKTLNDNLDIEDLKDFKYERLLAAENWNEAFAFLDICEKAAAQKDHYYGDIRKWTKKKLELATKLGKRDKEIAILKDLFVSEYDKRKYYDALKKIIDSADWPSVYPDLLKSAKQSVEAIGEFLVEEDETDWLYRLIRQENEKNPISYHQMIEYYPYLIPKYESDMRSRIKEAFLRNARQRFAPGEKCKNEWYGSFCKSLRDFRRLGAQEEVSDLVATFLAEFRTRRNFIHELKLM